MRRVVVTGMGLTTPLGNGVDINWKRLTSGVVGINKIENFDEASCLGCCRFSGCLVDAFVGSREDVPA